MKNSLIEKLRRIIGNLGSQIRYDILGGGLKKALIFLSVLIITSLVVAIPSVISRNEVKDLILNQLGHNAENIALTTAVLIERDLEDFKALEAVEDYKNGGYDVEYYQSMLASFQKIKKESGVTFIYAEKQASDSEIMYLFDGEDQKSHEFSSLGEIEKVETIERTVFETGKSAVTGISYTEEWGYLLTGFAPITDPVSGEVLGVVGVDYSIDYFSKVFQHINLVFMIGVFLIILLTAIIVYRFLHITFDTQETDYITGLRNRHFHEVQMRRLIRKAKLSGMPLSLIMMDLDDFKKVNDKHGHLTGDAVLKAVARVIKNQTRDTDICSRYGGDEFVILLPDTNEKQAAHIAERIREVIGNIALLDEAQNNLFSTASIGVAEWGKGMSGEVLTDSADKAMYASKETGRNKVTIYGTLEDNFGTFRFKKNAR